MSRRGPKRRFGNYVTKHGLAGTAEHNIWCGMRKRCNNPHDRLYPYYGGRGIRVCERWSDFATFLADMGPRPSPVHSVERRDNGHGYEPGNCYWATRIEQMRNRRGNLYVTYRGETLCVAAWAERLGIDHNTIRRRIKRGQPPELALRAARQGWSPNRRAAHA